MEAIIPKTLKVAPFKMFKKKQFMEYDDALVLKLSKRDKSIIRKVAKQKRLSMSAYVRNTMYSKALQDVEE